MPWNVLRIQGAGVGAGTVGFIFNASPVTSHSCNIHALMVCLCASASAGQKFNQYSFASIPIDSLNLDNKLCIASLWSCSSCSHYNCCTCVRIFIYFLYRLCLAKRTWWQALCGQPFRRLSLCTHFLFFFFWGRGQQFSFEVFGLRRTLVGRPGNDSYCHLPFRAYCGERTSPPTRSLPQLGGGPFYTTITSDEWKCSNGKCPFKMPSKWTFFWGVWGIPRKKKLNQMNAAGFLAETKHRSSRRWKSKAKARSQYEIWTFCLFLGRQSRVDAVSFDFPPDSGAIIALLVPFPAPLFRCLSWNWVILQQVTNVTQFPVKKATTEWQKKLVGNEVSRKVARELGT